MDPEGTPKDSRGFGERPKDASRSRRSCNEGLEGPLRTPTGSQGFLEMRMASQGSPRIITDP
eukprot:818100-Pyramimonas_sp.AAC.1